MKKILLVEEKLNFVEYYTEFLLLRGYKIEVTNLQTNLLDKIELFKPDLIMFDTDIPKYKINNFIDQFTNSKYQLVPILLLTRISEVIENNIFQRVKNTDYISRTGNPWEISEKISSLINKQFNIN